MDNQTFVPVIEKLPSTLGEALAADLSAKGMTQEDLGKRLGISQQAISAWIKDSHIPTKRLDELIEMFGPGEPHLLRYLRSRPRANEIYSAYRQHRNADLHSTTAEEPKAPNLREHTVAADFVRALPERLRPHATRPTAGLRLGASIKRFDYLSDKVALELRSGPLSRNMVNNWALDSALLRLAVARHATLDVAPTRRYVLAVVFTDPTLPAGFHSLSLQRIATDASILGVQLVTTTSAADVALLVTGLEDGTLPPELYFSEEEPE